MWVEPKTNWVRTDIFEVDTDWVRITGNIEYLKTLARPFFGNIILEEMPEQKYDDLPYVEKLNAIENNLETLGKNTLNLPSYPSKNVQYENQAIWDYGDLNRIERFELTLEGHIKYAGENRDMLAFTLGEGVPFATFI